MRAIEAYQSADGVLHASERAATARDDDMLGEELDGVLRLIFAVDGIGRAQEHKAILRAMGKRAELETACVKILAVLQHGRHNEGD